MPWFDLPEALRAQRCPSGEPDDLDAFWEQQIQATRAVATATKLEPYEAYRYPGQTVTDVTFSGAGATPVKAWYLRPAQAEPDELLPLVVHFVGYGGGRGRPWQHSWLPTAGLAALVVDVRGQGSSGSAGQTSDLTDEPGGPEHPGVMTRGLRSPQTAYLTRLYLDAVRAVDITVDLPGVDPDRVAVVGTSQGGGLALAAAALVPDRISVCQANLPFLCDINRAIRIATSTPYLEVARYLAIHDDAVADVTQTLRYLDNATLASRISAQCLLSVGLMDEVCPPSTVWAAYNSIRAPKELAVFEFGVHEVPAHHVERQLDHLLAALLPSGEAAELLTSRSARHLSPGQPRPVRP